MARSPESADLPRQVEVVHGDLTAATTLDRCLDGVGAVFLMRQALAVGERGTSSAARKPEWLGRRLAAGQGACWRPTATRGY